MPQCFACSRSPHNVLHSPSNNGRNAYHPHAHMYMRAHVGLPWSEFFVTAQALYSIVKQCKSKLIMSNGPSSYQELPMRLTAVQFFPCSWVPNTFENMVALIQLSTWSLHSQFCRASVRHALRLRHSVKMIMSQVQFQIAKFKFRQYENTFFSQFRQI